MDLFDLCGKTAIVTRGTQGIGFGIARGLGKAGATVIIANRREAPRLLHSTRSTWKDIRTTCTGC